MVLDKPKELENSKLEIEAKIARLKKLRDTPEEEFSSAKEKGSLTFELEQIIFDLNKSSEGMRPHYESDREPVLSDYFPELGKTKTYGDMQILDGSSDPEPTQECA